MAVNGEAEREKVLLTWTAKSRPFNPNQEKTRSVVIVLGVLITIILLLAGERMLVVLMAAGAFYYYAQNKVPPEMVDYSITNKGLKAYGRTYIWQEFNSWWIESKVAEDLLGLDIISGMMGRMYVPLGTAKRSELERILNEYLENKKPEETSVDKLTKWVGEKFPLENKV